MAALSTPRSQQGDPDNVYWDSTIANFNGGLNGPITSLTVYNGKLIVGGDFTTAGGITVNHIAAWDGSSWSSLDSGIDGAVYTLATYDNVLIAGGHFRTAGDVSASDIAAWNGSSWSSLGTGVSPMLGLWFPPQYCDRVNALTVDDKSLIIAGEFAEVGGVSANRIASWDGAIWSGLDSGLGWALDVCDFSVHALGVYDKQLIAGGGFSVAGGVTASQIAAWNGNSWSPLGSGMFGWFYDGAPESCHYLCEVYALTAHNGNLVAAGIFFTAGDDTVNSIAAWDGSSWASLGSGFEGGFVVGGVVSGLAVCDGQLFAAGHFDTTGGAATSNIAAWDGTSWSTLGSGLNDTVTSLAVYDGKLAVGGSFTRAGDKESKYLAMWTKQKYDCGDADGSGQVNLVDIVYIVNWMFACGPAPVDEAAGDYNCDGRPNIADAVYMVNYIFRSGPQPCAACK